MSIEIKQVGITEQKDRTWGRVYVDYIQNGQEKFIFRNYINFEEKNFTGSGSFESEPAYTWFDTCETTSDYMAVAEGEYDNMTLTSNSKHSSSYGTPSKLVLSLIQDLDDELFEDVKNRRGWYKKE